ncbi:flagellar hook protein FlgE [Puerhibacterium puerhi]|uniref:flagellar hook protein FlgE n=1 Tax=Puerhibacterium puerhi TaxID=2692623 RepID=UPI00135908AF|nr:flagellar hook protein FlgE [Puerhibacterium puerhi]
MLRSLFSGISGLKSHQTMLDVTGNNIANVNTTGFKSSSVQFQDTLSQMVQFPAGAQDGQGGTNPAQVGLGVRVAGISTNLTQGSSQLTGKATDMMIQGDGYFVVRRGAETFYTRSGAFDFDSLGQMVLPGDGAIVQGWAAGPGGVIDTNAPLQDLRVQVGTVMNASATTAAAVTGNLDGSAAVGKVVERTVEVYDAAGNASELALTFERTATGWTVTANDDPATAVDLTIQGDGSLTRADGTPTGSITVGGVTVGLGALTSQAGADTMQLNTTDGNATGVLQSFAIDASGVITGSFSNGLRQALGQVAMGSFVNPGGLEKAGGSLLRAGVNSGAAQIGAAGVGGRGTLAGGALEMSNVDLSNEFTNLIVAQRGFQASSRVITTSDEVLNELVNLKR